MQAPRKDKGSCFGSSRKERALQTPSTQFCVGCRRLALLTNSLHLSDDKRIHLKQVKVKLIAKSLLTVKDSSKICINKAFKKVK